MQQIEISNTKKSNAGILDTLFSFKGRFSRKQYFWLTFAVNLASAACISGAIPLFKQGQFGLAITLFLIISVISIWAVLAIAVKRSHDLNKSGNFLWISLIPLVSIWVAIVLTFFRGTTGENAYGSDPLAKY